MLTVLSQIIIVIIIIMRKLFESDGYIYGMDCGDSFVGICLSSNSPNCIH